MGILIQNNQNTTQYTLMERISGVGNGENIK